MKHQTIALGLMTVLVAGCALTPIEDTKTAETKSATCEREYSVGSMMPHKDCAPPMSSEDRQRLQSELGNKIHPNTAGVGGG